MASVDRVGGEGHTRPEICRWPAQHVVSYNF